MPQTPTSIGDQLAGTTRSDIQKDTITPATQEQTTRQGTEYTLLRSVTTPELVGWEIIGTVPATSAREAIRRHADQVKETATLVAVPSRSWHPVTVTVETVSRVTLA